MLTLTLKLYLSLSVCLYMYVSLYVCVGESKAGGRQCITQEGKRQEGEC